MRQPANAGGSVPRRSRAWLLAALAAVLPACSMAGAPSVAPPEPALEGPPLVEGVYTPDQAQATARLVREAEGRLEQGDFNGALIIANQVQEGFATSPGSLFALRIEADALRGLGEYTTAEAAATRYAARFDPTDPEYARGMLLRARSRLEGDLPGGIEGLFEVPVTAEETVLVEADSLASEWAARLEGTELRALLEEAPPHPRILPAFAAELAIRRYLAGDEAEATQLAESVLAAAPGPTVADRARSVLEGRVGDELEVAAVLGAILPTTGSPSVRRLAQELAEGVEVALSLDESEFASPIRFISVEDAVTPAAMAAAASSLEDQGAAAILGPLQDNEFAAVLQARSEAIPVLSPTAGVVPTGVRGGFALTGVDPGAGEALAELVIDQGARQVVVLLPDISEMREELRWFSEALEARGGTITRTLTYPPGATGFREQMAEVMRIRPAGLVLLLPPEDVELVAPQITFYGVDQLPGLRIFGSSAWTTGPVLEGVQARSLEGVYSITSWLATNEFGPGWNDFVTAYETYFQRSLTSPTAALGYDAARLLIEASRNGGGDPQATLEALERVRGFPGATGMLSVIDGRIQRSYVPVRIEGGTLQMVEG